MSRKNTIDHLIEKNVEQILKFENDSIHRRSPGEQIADAVTTSVGSWSFVVIQGLLLILWIAVNFRKFAFEPWDPYPFVLLNLVLSFQAAFATPIILMSENRQARLSERRNQLDLQINLLAEQENTLQLTMLRMLCAKAGIEVHGREEQALEQPINPESILRQIIKKSQNPSEAHS